MEGKKVMYKVYKHTAPNNKVYIGITQNDVTTRWGREGQGYRGQYFYRAICKYGWSNIEHEIVCEVSTKEEAEELEKKLILEYNSTDKMCGYNVDYGGNAHSLQTKEKISKSRTGIVLSELTKQKLSQINTGKHHDIETKKKISQNHARYWLNKTRSEETKEKISKSKRGKPLNHAPTRKFGLDNWKSRKVRCLETGEEFNCISDARKKYAAVHISEVCNGKRKTAAGYRWEYVM